MTRAVKKFPIGRYLAAAARAHKARRNDLIALQLRLAIDKGLYEEAHQIEVFFWEIVPAELVVRLAELTIPRGKIRTSRIATKERR
jgi:hypothetical protein